MVEKISYIPSRVKNCAEGGHVAGARDIVDDGSGITLDELVGNKKYDSDYFSGIGRVVLKKNIVNSVNTLTQDMFYKGEVGSRVPNTNTIYIIQYDFTLGEDITIPANCVLEFNGGSISGNGTGKDTVTGNNTQIKAILNKVFNTEITLEGTWDIAEVYSEWFGARGDSITDDTASIQAACNLASIASGKTCKLLSKRYMISDSIIVPKRTVITGVYSRSYGDPIRQIKVTCTCIYLKRKQNLNDGYFVLTEGCSISNLSFYEYEQDHNNIVAYAPVISDDDHDEHHIQIKHLTFINIYSGIHFRNVTALLTIEDILGCVLYRGITMDQRSPDVTRIRSIHFNYSIISPNNDAYTIGYKYYAVDNAIGLDIYFADGILIDDFFAYGLKIGILLRESGAVAALIVNSGFDCCCTGIENHQHETMISNCYFTCVYTGIDPEKTTVACIKDYASARISNCKFHAFEHKAIDGHDTYIDNCTFYLNQGYFKDDNTGSIIFLDGTKCKVSNCVFDLQELDVVGMWIIVFTSIGVYEATGNIFYNYNHVTNGYLFAPNGTLVGAGNATAKGVDGEYVLSDMPLLDAQWAFNAFGQTDQRPQMKKRYNGRQYFDLELAKPIWWIITGEYPNGHWVDATGTHVPDPE